MYESYYNLQKSVQKTDTNLESFSTTLKDVERCLSTTQLQQEVESVTASSSVLEVLESISTVKNEYNHLRQDLHEVQQLQREMAEQLQYQMRSMAHTYNILKKKIEASSTPLPVALPSLPSTHTVGLRHPMAPLQSQSSSTGAISSLSSSPPSH